MSAKNISNKIFVSPDNARYVNKDGAWVPEATTGGSGSPGVPIRSWDFDTDGVTCKNADILAIANHSYQIFFNNINRYIFSDGALEPGATYVEWELTEDGNFKINIPGFDARIHDDYRLYVFPFLAGTTPPIEEGSLMTIDDSGGVLMIDDTDKILIE